MADFFTGHGARGALSAVVVVVVVVLAATGLAAVSGAAKAFRPAGSAAAARRRLPPADWIIKSNDSAELGAQAVADGVTLPSFQYVACGSQSDPLACQPQQTPIFTNFSTFRTAVRKGLTGPVLIDYETWSLTPAQQAKHPVYWIERTQDLVRAHARQHIFTIEAPGGKRTEAQLINEDVAAARSGSPVVSIQSQFGVGHPKSVFKPFIDKAIAAVRKVSSRVVILAGIATDAGGVPVSAVASGSAMINTAGTGAVVTAGAMTQSYHYAISAGAAGFWLNASKWAPPRGTGCAPAGCPQTAIQFLENIGAIVVPSPTPTPTPPPSPSPSLPAP